MPADVEALRKLSKKVSEACYLDGRGRNSPVAFGIYIDNNIDKDFPVLEVYPAVGQWFGGARDGTNIYNAIDVDLVKLMAIFAEESKDEQFAVSYDSGGDSSDEDEHIEVYTPQYMVKIFPHPPDDHPEGPMWGIDDEGGFFDLDGVDNADEDEEEA